MDDRVEAKIREIVALSGGVVTDFDTCPGCRGLRRVIDEISDVLEIGRITKEVTREIMEEE